MLISTSKSKIDYCSHMHIYLVCPYINKIFSVELPPCSLVSVLEVVYHVLVSIFTGFNRSVHHMRSINRKMCETWLFKLMMFSHNLSDSFIGKGGEIQCLKTRDRDCAETTSGDQRSKISAGLAAKTTSADCRAAMGEQQ